MYVKSNVKKIFKSFDLLMDCIKKETDKNELKISRCDTDDVNKRIFQSIVDSIYYEYISKVQNPTNENNSLINSDFVTSSLVINRETGKLSVPVWFFFKQIMIFIMHWLHV